MPNGSGGWVGRATGGDANATLSMPTYPGTASPPPPGIVERMLRTLAGELWGTARSMVPKTSPPP